MVLSQVITSVLHVVATQYIDTDCRASSAAHHAYVFHKAHLHVSDQCYIPGSLDAYREVWPHGGFGQSGMSPEEELEALHILYMEIRGSYIHSHLHCASRCTLMLYGG